MDDNFKKQRDELLQAFSAFTQIGFTIAACVIIGVVIGKFLDDFFGTSPWLLLLFSLLGMAASFKTMFDVAKRK